MLRYWKIGTTRQQPATWSDVYRMSENFLSVQMRGDERRGAAYFQRKAFLPIHSFTDAVWGKKDFNLVEKFRKEGTPQLYHLKI
jgi:hypothetical protein